MNAIFLNELKQGGRSLLYWSVAILLAAAMGVAEYPFLAENLDTIMSSIDLMPKAVLVIFGIDGFSLNTSLEYYLTMFYYYSLVAFFHAAHTGFLFIAKEERDRTADFLYVKPVGRTRTVAAKLIAGVVHLAAVASVTALSTILMMLPVLDAFHLLPVVLVTVLGMFLTQLVYFGLGAACAALFRRYRFGSMAAYGTVLVTYALAVAVRTFESAEILNVFSPFQYFPASNVANGGLDPRYIVLSLGVTGLAAAFTITKYRTRELRG